MCIRDRRQVLCEYTAFICVVQENSETSQGPIVKEIIPNQISADYSNPNLYDKLQHISVPSGQLRYRGITNKYSSPPISSQNYDASANVQYASSTQKKGAVSGGLVGFMGNAVSSISTVFQLTFKKKALPSSSTCLLYTSPSPRDRQKSRMPSSA
eukprot:TRINITY_DN8198_c0_g1_i1.p1 TRINITY_DN8198_c0_g1~~TRINITY_DN8198_c0_g1_i1.p1  ORF type:complete len:155 (+),score=27.66 TRINITY_DN8198_c0_g1_i1:65-529(+)